MAEQDIHPGSFVGDTVEEFKKLPTWGKIAVGLVFVGVIVFVWYQKTHSTSGPSITSAQPVTGGIPAGATPVYDPNGNILGYTLGQGGATGGSTGGGNPPPNPPPPTPAPGFQWPAALQGMKIWQGTVSHNFFFGPLGPQPDEKNQTLLSTLFPQGTLFSVLPNGDLGYQLPGGQVVDSGIQLTNGNPPPDKDSSPSQNSQKIQQGMRQQQFSQSPSRKLGVHTVQPGESPQKIAAIHGISATQLTAANPKTPVTPGQKLIVPRK